jgi:hypothetical protein
MKLLRAVLGILTAVVGLIVLAAGLCAVAVTLAIAQGSHQPISIVSLAGELIACAIGLLFFALSRAIDPEGGPVRSYRERRRKPRVHA